MLELSFSVIWLSELVQQIFKYCDIQNLILITPDKELNIFIYGSRFCVIIKRVTSF